MSLIKTLLVSIIVAFVNLNVVWANETYQRDLHLLLISNGNYLAAPDVNGAHISAMVVKAELERRFHIASATLLRSDKTRLISKNDVFDIVESFKARGLSGAKGDFLFVYYIGHGFGEGISWNFFIQPGNVEIPTQINDFDVESLAKKMVYLGFLNDSLNELNVPFTLLVDSCYEGELVDYRLPVLSTTAETNIRDTIGIVKYMNEFHTSNPVIFSAAPGTRVKTVKHPFDNSLQYSIGPLARRLVLALEKTDINHLTNFSNIVSQLKNGKLDDATSAVISNARLDESLVFTPNHHKTANLTSPSTIFGTAGKDDHQTLLSHIENTELSEDQNLQIEVVSGSAAIIGQQGGFISDGEDHVFALEIDDFQVTNLESGELEITINENRESWSFAFAVPEGEKFLKKDYMNITRHPFQEGSQAGLLISGDGRGCNEVSGNFSVDDVRYEEGLLSFISLEFEQLCDDEKVSMRGMMILELKN